MAIDINKYTKICVWILASGQSCGKSVQYHMLKDEDNNTVRSYDYFCSEHKAKAAAQKDEDDD